MKSILIIMHSPPYHKDLATELLDSALVHAAFGMPVSLLFQGDGVWQLVQQQATQGINRKNLLAQLGALGLYDIEHIYVDERSLRERNLLASHLGLEAVMVDAAGIQKLHQNAQLIMRS